MAKKVAHYINIGQMYQENNRQASKFAVFILPDLHTAYFQIRIAEKYADIRKQI
ncbi:MAG: hypothetical protein GY749_46875 [Desulfobacteraceae bacterium]|nr:hypothetical protein [Desulfobacteraceae bacterium]